MISFKQKNFGKILESIRKNAPLGSLALSTAALGMSGANVRTNSKRAKEDKDFHEEQMKAIYNLSNTMKEDSSETKNPSFIKRKIRFLQKNNSYTTDFAIKGAKLGAGAGIIGASGFLPNKLGFIQTKEGEKVREIESPSNFWKIGWKKKVADVYNNASDSGAVRRSIVALGSVAIGASLGALVGVIYDIAGIVDKKKVNRRLLTRVVSDLKKIGFKEDEDFTVNPKTASLLKTKVCLGISRTADEMKFLVNTVNDPKLEKLAREITKNLPSMSTRTERVTDRFNDITITTSSGQDNSTFVASIAEKFIRSGYSIQLVEVG